MQLKSLSLLYLFFPILLLALTGCTGAAPSAKKEIKETSGQSLRITCPGDPTASVLRSYSRGWATRNNQSVNLVSMKSLPEGDPSDIWVIDAVDLPRLAAAQLVRPVPREITEPINPFSWGDLLPLYRENLLMWNQQAWGLPLLGETPLFLYRADLLADAGHQAAYQKKFNRPLKPPGTWEEFADLADYFQSAPERKGMSSLPPLPTDDDLLDREFGTIAACYARPALAQQRDNTAVRSQEQFSFQYNYSTGDPLIGGPGFVEALNLLKRLQACRATNNSLSVIEAFRTNQAVLAIADAPTLLALQQLPELRDKIGVSKMPGASRYYDSSGSAIARPDGNRIPYLGNRCWLALVPKSSPQPEAAWSLLADLAGRERSGQMVIDPKHGGGAIRREQLQYGRWDVFQLDQARTAQLKSVLEQTLSHPGLTNPAFPLRIPDLAAHQAILLRAVRDVLQDGKSNAAQALARVANEWRALDEKIGKAKIAADYRLSVGLLPQ